MRSGIIAKKLGMTRIYTEEGAVVPVTVLKVDNVHVVGHKTKDKHGYTAVQLGSGTPKVKNLTKADRGVFAKASVEPKRKLQEFRVSEDMTMPVGAEVHADHFIAGRQWICHSLRARCGKGLYKDPGQGRVYAGKVFPVPGSYRGRKS